MDVYLVQHGLAAAAAEDPKRPLTPQGRAEVERVAGHARSSGVRVDRIVHSGKLRAAQTAGILAAGLSAAGEGAVERRAGLAPGDDVEPVARWLAEEADAPSAPGSIAVVGHLPFLDRLASLLVVGDPGVHVIRFRNAGLVRLVPTPEAPWPDGAGLCVAWVLVPELC